MKYPGISACILSCILVILTLIEPLHGQTAEIDGAKAKEKAPFEVVATPYLWLPWINGTLNIDRKIIEAQPDVSVSPIDLLKSLRAAALMHVTMSKGHFVSDVDYIFLLLKSGSKTFTSASDNHLTIKEVKLYGHIAEATIGGRYTTGIVIFDGYVGVRYNNFRVDAELSTSQNNGELTGGIDFWDGLIGARLQLLPHDKVSLSLKADVGGFKGGSRYSWTTEVKAGYAVSRLVDIFAGFKSYSFDYDKEGTDNSLDAAFFGFEVGASFYLPKRPEFGSKAPEE